MYILKGNSRDSNRFFSEDHKSGILIQHKIGRAIYFVDNINIDEFFFESSTTTNDVEAWIASKKRHYEELFISTRIGIL